MRVSVLMEGGWYKVRDHGVFGPDGLLRIAAPTHPPTTSRRGQYAYWVATDDDDDDVRRVLDSREARHALGSIIVGEGNERVTSRLWHMLCDCHGLKHVQFSGSDNLTDLEGLVHAPAVCQLGMFGVAADVKTTSVMADRLFALRAYESTIDDQILIALGRSGSLAHLDLFDSRGFGTSGVEGLAHSSTLKSVWLNASASVAADAIVRLLSIPTLNELWISAPDPELRDRLERARTPHIRLRFA
jgi:hypothetical protein